MNDIETHRDFPVYVRDLYKELGGIEERGLRNRHARMRKLARLGRLREMVTAGRAAKA